MGRKAKFSAEEKLEAVKLYWEDGLGTEIIAGILEVDSTTKSIGSATI